MISGFCVTFLSGGVLIARFQFNLIVLDEFTCIWEPVSKNIFTKHFHAAAAKHHTSNQSQVLPQQGDQVECLLHAVSHNNSEMLKLLISELKIQVDVRGSEGRTALHEAASKGYDMMIYILSEAGAQVNALDTQGDTPLHCAVKN